MRYSSRSGASAHSRPEIANFTPDPGMRKSYGFRTFRVTELALYHSLGKLPEPELTHRFF